MPGFELVGDEERAAVNEVFDEGGILFRHGFDAARQRFHVVEFEEAFARYMGVSYGLAVSSGTAALRVGLASLGIRPGDEVITQAFTFVATVEAILEAGAVPVVVNGDDTLNMDPEDLNRAVTSRTRAVVPVHMLGVSAEMDAILDTAARHGLPVLEDNCESPGATYGGKQLGSLGDAGAFSFDFGKMLTTGEGGMLITDSADLDKLAREYHDHGHENNPEFPRGRDTHRIRGFNYRMGELQGAIGLAQLRKLDHIVSRNRQHYAALEEGLRRIRGIEFRRVPDRCESLCDTLILQAPTEGAAAAVAARMAEAGIGTKNLPDAMEWHFAGYWDHIFSPLEMDIGELRRRLLPTYQRLSRCLAVPVMVSYSDDQVDHIIDVITRAVGEAL